MINFRVELSNLLFLKQKSMDKPFKIASAKLDISPLFFYTTAIGFPIFRFARTCQIFHNKEPLIVINQ